MGIILFSTGCPRCKVLKQELERRSIHYTENNSVAEMLAIGIEKVPVISVDGKLYLYNDALEYISKLEVCHEEQ